MNISKKYLKYILLSFSLFIFTNQAFAAFSWDLDDPSDYTVSDSREVDVSSSIASLKEGTFLEFISAIDTPGSAYHADISTDGSTIYVADASSLQIIDITDLSSPAIIGSYSAPCHRVAVSSDQSIAYLAGNTGGLVIVDISNPATPTFITQYTTSGVARSVTLSADNNTAYVLFGGTSGSGGLVILDVSTPSSPSLIYSNSLTNSFQQSVLSSDENYLFIGDGSGLRIFDISTPASSALIGSVPLPNFIIDVVLSADDNTIYAASSGDGLAIIDVSNPALPVLIGAHDRGSGQSVALSADGTKVYLANGGRTLEIIDITTPAAPVLVGEFDATISGVISDDGDLIYAMNGSNGLTILRSPHNSEIYSKNKPYVTPNTGHVFASTLSSFIEISGTNNEGTISYQVSTDAGATWNYWNEAAWTTTTQTDGTETSSAADIDINISTLDTDGGSFTWRAYLNSNGTQKVELDSVAIEGTFLNVVLTDPTTDIDVNNEGWFPITTEVTCDSTDDCGEIELTLDPIGDFFFERTEFGGEEDCITDNVCIARADSDFGIHNSVSEVSFNWFDSPADTEWYNGACGADPTVHSYGYWGDVVGGGWFPPAAVGSPMCIHLITDDIYIDIEFQSWENTAFSYYRSTTGKGIIPTTPTQPFYTDKPANPVTVNLSAGETHTETFWVYADGTVGDSFDFFTYATPVGLPDFRQNSEKHEITLIAPAPNRHPTDIQIDAANSDTVDENQTTATAIGILTTTDPDYIADSHTYSLACTTAGADDALFQISGSNLQTNAVFDYETPTDNGADGTYEVCIRTTDDGIGNLTYDETVTITINDLNDTAPVITSSNTFSAIEDVADTTTLHTITFTDADTTNGTTIYTITEDTDNLFEVDNSGIISLQSGKSLDYAASTSHTIKVTVNDVVNTSAEQTITVTVGDVNDNAPV
ncbi:MAG: hypothetical protein GY702_12780, partial [Desulfobulbaceae bacterium]|nr:hypothetical protein [Desulfobulbaceae bacterium]